MEVILIYKKTLILSAFILIFVIAVYSYSKPIIIDNTYYGVIYSIDNGFEKNTDIIIKGEIQRNLIQKDKFIGEVTVDDNINLKLVMEDQGNKYIGLFSSSGSNGYTVIDGSIQASSDLSMVWLDLKEIDDRYSTKCYVAGPANDKEDGNKIAENILKK